MLIQASYDWCHWLHNRQKTYSCFLFSVDVIFIISHTHTHACPKCVYSPTHKSYSFTPSLCLFLCLFVQVGEEVGNDKDSPPTASPTKFPTPSQPPLPGEAEQSADSLPCLPCIHYRQQASESDVLLSDFSVMHVYECVCVNVQIK